MIHQYSSGAPGRHSSRSAAHPAPYPYPATRAAAAAAHQRLASNHASHLQQQQQQHASAGWATHQTAAYFGQQQHELRQRVAAGTIGGGFAVGDHPAQRQQLQQFQQQQQRLSFDRSTAAPVWAGSLSSTDSSPFSEAASDDFADGSGHAGDFACVDDDDESFEDGLVKDQYRGRAWSTTRRSSVAAIGGGFEPAQHYPAPVYQQQQQQQQPGHLDRLFNGLQLPPLVGQQQQQQQYALYGQHQQQQQQQQMLPPLQQQHYAPVSPPAPVAVEPAAPSSALPLAPFVADAIWSLLQQGPVQPAVASRKTQQPQQVQINGQLDDDHRWYPAGTGYQTPPQLTVDDFSLGPAGALAGVGNPYRLAPHAPAGFARFISQTLAQTLIGPAGVMLALYYVAHKMPVHAGGGEEGVHFRDELLAVGRRSEGGEAVARRVVTLGLAWANKWLDDNTFTNRSWSDVTHIPIDEINRLELSALATMSFDLSITDGDWAAWLGRLYSSSSDPLVRSYLVELADSLSAAEQQRAVEAELVDRRLHDAAAEREYVRHERLLQAQALDYQRQRAAAAATAAAQQQQQALYPPTSCARYYAGPTDFRPFSVVA